MIIYYSKRERRLWILALVVILGIYATIGLAGSMAHFLRARNLLENTFFFTFLLVVAVIIANGLRKKTSTNEIWLQIGVFLVFITITLRIETTPEHRTHLYEYGLLALIIYEALRERALNGGKVAKPALMAILITVILGWLDEGIQAIWPNRHYDIVDVGFNALAAVLAISANLTLRWLRSKLIRS
ncbi:MAG: VanZ family protein [Croceitalea sp.]|nr:VanZ family protein [Croceitalea sp.]